MNDQMEQIWRSKDGQCTGSKEEVEAYLKSKNPLEKMRFPYRALKYTETEFQLRDGANYTAGDTKQADAIFAFANLAPLIHETREAWNKCWANTGQDWRTYKSEMADTMAAQKLLLAYEEALKQVPQ